MENQTIIAPVKTNVDSIAVQDFMVKHDFTQVVNAVRENSNGYPYITFINSANVAENIYFSKAAALKVSAGQAVNSIGLKDYVMVLSTNSAGEQRWKISTGNSLRVNRADLF